MILLLVYSISNLLLLKLNLSIKQNSTNMTCILEDLQPRKGYLVDTVGCKIIEMDPFHSPTRKYFREKKLSNCSQPEILSIDNVSEII
ncbi:unnamed protein product [Allacma fusca]|uniref:Uncharacterized protein n=1 Tax=Allacma fusca TaxID=39272 RepID=A0A8J2KGY7_9HEXA|nr:unnamed protein product [Allacma fusca]